MKAVPIGLALNVSPYEGEERSARSQLIAEICERFLELSEIEGRQKTWIWIRTLAAIGEDSEASEAIWLYLRISTGDLGQLTASYSELGKKRTRTKQAQQQETERAMRVIIRHRPDLAEHLAELLRINRDAE